MSELVLRGLANEKFSFSKDSILTTKDMTKQYKWNQ